MHPDAINFGPKDDSQVAALRAWLNKFDIVVCSDADKLAKLKPCITVEAEYGDRCVQGTVLTLAHHGPRSANPCPCNTEVETGFADRISAANGPIGLSHVDLDTIGGLIRIAESQERIGGWKLGEDTFWQLAEFVDLNGAHRLAEAEANDIDLSSMWAYWAWERKRRFVAKSDGGPTDAGPYVAEAVTVLGQIFWCFDKPTATQRHDAGYTFKREQEGLSRDSFVDLRDGVCVRVHSTFTNHLYDTPCGRAQIIVGFNTIDGSITISKERIELPVHCAQLVQNLWGDKAGGHEGIAGSPRGQRMTLNDLEQVRNRCAVWLNR